MRRWNKSVTTLIAILVASIHCLAPAQTAKRKPNPIVRQVDRLIIQTTDPRSLFDLLSDSLQLPVAWPLTESAETAGGAVGVGNANIEVLRTARRKDTSASARAEARFMGLALEAYPLTGCLAEMKIRGIACNPPEPYLATLPDGSRGTSWTNVVLPQLSGPGLSIFLCEYNPAFLNVQIRRQQLGNRLALNDGGPLGIERIKEIVLGSEDPATDRSRWEGLLAPAAASPIGVWQAGRGPAIHLVADTRAGILRIVLTVKSLERARTFLDGKHLLGAVSAGEIAIAPRRIQGLAIRLVEK